MKELDTSQDDGASSNVAATQEPTYSCCCLSFLVTVLRGLEKCFASDAGNRRHGAVRNPYPVRGPMYSNSFYRTPPSTPPRSSSRSHLRGMVPPIRGYGSLSSNDGTSGANGATRPSAAGRDVDILQVKSSSTGARTKNVAVVSVTSRTVENAQTDGAAEFREGAEGESAASGWFSRLADIFRGWNLNLRTPGELLRMSHRLSFKPKPMSICSSHSLSEFRSSGSKRFSRQM